MAGISSKSAQELLFEITDELAHVGVHFHAIFDETAGVHHGAMIAPAKSLADVVEGSVGHSARKEHGDLARERDALRAALAGHVRQANVEMLGHFLLDH